MKALLYTKPYSFEYTDVPDPVIGDDDVLILQATEIDYDPELAPAVFELDLPKDVRWYRLNDQIKWLEQSIKDNTDDREPALIVQERVNERKLATLREEMKDHEYWLKFGTERRR